MIISIIVKNASLKGDEKQNKTTVQIDPIIDLTKTNEY